MGIDKKILNKTDRLDPDECKEMQKHPEIGYRILNTSDEFSEMARYILEHHKRWDGKGYPKGISGENMSIQARIIAVANIFDAMTHNRNCQKGLSDVEAIAEMRKCSGTKFDSKITKLFIEEYIH